MELNHVELHVHLLKHLNIYQIGLIDDLEHECYLEMDLQEFLIHILNFDLQHFLMDYLLNPMKHFEANESIYKIRNIIHPSGGWFNTLGVFSLNSTLSYSSLVLSSMLYAL